MAIKPGKGGSPGQPYQAPKEDPKNPYVPAPKKAKNINSIYNFLLNLILKLQIDI